MNVFLIEKQYRLVVYDGQFLGKLSETVPEIVAAPVPVNVRFVTEFRDYEHDLFRTH